MPSLLFFTDPTRTPDAEAIAETLPRGAAIVFRAFGDPEAPAQGARLRQIARRRGLKLLIGADARLAARLKADGVHLPERLASNARALKRRHSGWIITAAAHSLTAARSARAAGADAAVVSTVFASNSRSARAPMGPVRLASLVQRAGLPVYALGGINDDNAARLARTRLVGLAAVEGFRT